MAKKKEICQDKRGLIVRNLGWRLNGNKYVQQKFYLERDEARGQNSRASNWRSFGSPSAAAGRPTIHREPEGKLSSRVDLETPNGIGAAPEQAPAMIMSVGIGDIEFAREGRPVWDEVTFAVADAIRNGETLARIPIPDRFTPLGFANPVLAPGSINSVETCLSTLC